MRKSGMAEKYVEFVQDMYEGSKIMARHTVGTTESFKIKIELHQRLVLSLFLFTVIMDRVINEVSSEPL